MWLWSLLTFYVLNKIGGGSRLGNTNRDGCTWPSPRQVWEQADIDICTVMVICLAVLNILCLGSVFGV